MSSVHFDVRTYWFQTRVHISAVKYGVQNVALCMWKILLCIFNILSCMFNSSISCDVCSIYCDVNSITLCIIFENFVMYILYLWWNAQNIHFLQRWHFINCIVMLHIACSVYHFEFRKFNVLSLHWMCKSFNSWRIFKKTFSFVFLTRENMKQILFTRKFRVRLQTIECL